MAKPQMYTFADDTPVKGSSRKQRRGHKKSSGGGGGLNASLGAKLERHFGNEAVRQHKQEKHRAPEKDAQSLTYSASSSVGGSSNAGESTDSSFADIMKVLDLDDSTEIAALMAKEGITDMSAQEYVHKAQVRAATHANKRSSGRSVRSGASVACSLAYSEDGESTVADAYNNRYGYGAAVGGGGGGGAVSPTTKMMTMQSGQPSGERNGSGFGVMTNLNNSSDDLKSPATIREDRVHKRDSPQRKEKTFSSSAAPPRPTVHGREEETNDTSKSRARAQTAESSGSNSSNPAAATPPPRAPSSRRKTKKASPMKCNDSEEFDPLVDCDVEAWYSQWWMCGFGDAIKNVVAGPKTNSKKKAKKTTKRRGEC